jgi:hypothetical protein
MKTSSDQTADTAPPLHTRPRSGYRSRCVTDRVPEANLSRRDDRCSCVASVSEVSPDTLALENRDECRSDGGGFSVAAKSSVCQSLHPAEARGSGR